MGTFLEFYLTMLKFINFKLYSEIGMEYPPEIDNIKENNIFFSYKSFVLKNKIH